MDTIGSISDSAVRGSIPYGAHFVGLADGASVRLRAACNDDDALRRLFFTLSDTTRYLYFCAGVPSNQTWAERFAALSHLQGYRSYALVAEVANEVIGFALFSQGPRAEPRNRSADLGIVLTDAWQGRGLGSHVVERLTAEARSRGVTSLTAEVLWGNQRMLRLAQRMFPDLRIAYGSGSCTLTIDL